LAGAAPESRALPDLIDHFGVSLGPNAYAALTDYLDDDAAVDVPIRGHMILALAAEGGFVDLVKRILDRGADVNQSKGDGWTPLLAAATSRAPKLVELLTDRGADVNTIAPSGASPHDLARASGAAASAQLIHAAGGRPHAPAGSTLGDLTHTR
jgi:ankyrin repeat protein